MSRNRALAAMRMLFMSLFNASQLRRFVRYLDDGQSLSDELPVGGVTLSELSDALVALLEAHGRLDDELFDSLTEERPRRAREIRKVRDELRTEDLLSSGQPAAPVTNADTAADPWDVFLAHAGPDTRRVRRYYDELLRLARERGQELRVFLDEACLAPGDVWTVELPKAIAASRVMVVFLSTATDQAWFAGDEIQAAIERMRKGEMRIVPVYLDGRGEGQAYGLSQVHALDAQEHNLTTVAEAIMRGIDKARAESP